MKEIKVGDNKSLRLFEFNLDSNKLIVVYHDDKTNKIIGDFIVALLDKDENSFEISSRTELYQEHFIEGVQSITDNIDEIISIIDLSYFNDKAYNKKIITILKPKNFDVDNYDFGALRDIIKGYLFLEIPALSKEPCLRINIDNLIINEDKLIIYTSIKKVY